MLLCALAAEAQAQRVAVDATAHAERVLANMPRFEMIQQQQPSKTVDTADRSLDALERRLPTADALKSADAASIQAILAALPSADELADAASASAVEQLRRAAASVAAATAPADVARVAWQPERPEQKAKRERIARLLTRVVVGRREGDRDGALLEVAEALGLAAAPPGARRRASRAEAVDALARRLVGCASESK